MSRLPSDGPAVAQNAHVQVRQLCESWSSSSPFSHSPKPLQFSSWCPKAHVPGDGTLHSSASSNLRWGKRAFCVAPALGENWEVGGSWFALLAEAYFYKNVKYEILLYI